jgi:nitronate monooxygenase
MTRSVDAPAAFSAEYKGVIALSIENSTNRSLLMLHTRICQLLGIDHPIMNAPMGGTATAELAAAVSIAGGFGMIGGTSRGGAAWLREQIRLVRSHTDRPFGVGFISSFPNVDELFQVAIEERVTAINHSFADPTPYVKRAHDAGVLLFNQVQTVAQARIAAQAGVDLVIAQGTEAGGHSGSIGTLSLVPAVVDAVAPIPVVAAGGIADGRGLAAVLMLGAEGAWIGTRFVASKEWAGHEWEKQAVVAAGTDDTIRTNVYDLIYNQPFPSGIADRMLRNAYIEQWQGRDAELFAQRRALRAQLREAEQRGDTRMAGVSAGVASGLIQAIEPAVVIVQRIVSEAEQLLTRRSV